MLIDGMPIISSLKLVTELIESPSDDKILFAPFLNNDVKSDDDSLFLTLSYIA